VLLNKKSQLTVRRVSGSQRNKNVFSVAQTLSSLMFCCRRSTGRLFHSRGPVTAKLLSPSRVCVRGNAQVWACPLTGRVDVPHRWKTVKMIFLYNFGLYLANYCLPCQQKSSGWCCLHDGWYSGTVQSH